MTDRLEQRDFDDLSAWLDGQLPAERAGEVERLCREDPAWRNAHRELLAIGQAMDGVVVPAPAAGLAERIIAGVAERELPLSDFEDLSAYVDGQLSPDRAAQIEQLIARSPIWRRAHSELLALDEAMAGAGAPVVAGDLAGRIIAGVAGADLSAEAREDISAYVDGELSAERAGEVERLIAGQAAWRLAYEELQAVDRAMDDFVVPGGAEGLAERVIARTRRVQRWATVLRVAAWVAPAAAAAAIILVVVTALNQPGKVRPVAPAVADATPAELDKSQAYQGVPKAERPQLDEVIINHLSFFRDYEVAEDFETLQAIEKLEKQGT